MHKDHRVVIDSEGTRNGARIIGYARLVLRNLHRVAVASP